MLVNELEETNLLFSAVPLSDVFDATLLVRVLKDLDFFGKSWVMYSIFCGITLPLLVICFRGV